MSFQKSMSKVDYLLSSSGFKDKRFLTHKIKNHKIGEAEIDLTK